MSEPTYDPTSLEGVPEAGRARLQQNRQGNGSDNENARQPGRGFRQQVRRRARSKGCLRALSAEGSGEVG